MENCQNCVVLTVGTMQCQFGEFMGGIALLPPQVPASDGSRVSSAPWWR